MEKYPQTDFLKSQTSNSEEIDIKVLIKFFIRNKLIIGVTSIIIFVLACLYSLTLKRIWEGEFQIVLNNEVEKDFSRQTRIANFLNSGKTNDLETEVAILESTSILKPVYQFLIFEKQIKNKDYSETYRDWKKNLDVQLQRNTSVLNIVYRDNDKELIIPLLEKISLAYQDYSGRNLRRNQELTKNYLLDQINLYKEKSSSSLKFLQNYALEQDLIYPEINNINKMNNVENPNIYNSDKFLFKNIDIENVRIKASNDIREIDLKLKKIKEVEDSVGLQFIASINSSLVEKDYEILKDIELELLNMRSKFKDEDLNIINLMEKRKLALEFLRDRGISHLLAEKLRAETIMEASMRPKGVILKYKELIRQAARDEATLVNLEDQLILAELEEAKLKDPWELISKPTLKIFPVGPSRKNIGFLGIFVGFIFGSLISFYKEKKSGMVYDFLSLKNIFNVPIIEKFNKNEIFSNSEKILFLNQFFAKRSNVNLGLIYLGNSDNEIESIKKLIEEKIDKKIKLEFFNSSNIFKKNITTQENYIMVNMNSLRADETINFKRRLGLINLKIAGIVVFQ